MREFVQEEISITIYLMISLRNAIDTKNVFFLWLRDDILFYEVRFRFRITFPKGLLLL